MPTNRQNTQGDRVRSKAKVSSPLQKKVRALKLAMSKSNHDFALWGIVSVIVLMVIVALVAFFIHLKHENDAARAYFDERHPVANFDASEVATDFFVADKNAPLFESRIEELSLTVKTVAPGSTVVDINEWKGAVFLKSLDSSSNVSKKAGEWRLNIECVVEARCDVGDDEARLTVSSVPGASTVDDALSSVDPATKWEPVSLCGATGLVSSPHFTEAVVEINGYAYRIVGNSSMTQMQNDEAWKYLHGSLCFETHQGDHSS